MSDLRDAITTVIGAELVRVAERSVVANPARIANLVLAVLDEHTEVEWATMIKGIDRTLLPGTEAECREHVANNDKRLIGLSRRVSAWEPIEGEET